MLPMTLVVAAVILLTVPSLGLSAHSAGDTGSVIRSGLIPIAAPSVNLLPPGENFSTYLGNDERTSADSSEPLINVTTASSLQVLWNFSAGLGGVQSQPVEQNGVSFFGSRTGYEFAVNATNATVLWKTYLGEDNSDPACGPYGLGVTSSATVVGDTLYVDGGNSQFYALNSSTGSIEWQTPIGGSTDQGYYDWSSPLIYDDRAYIGIASACDRPLVPAGLAEYSLANHTLIGYLNTSAGGDNGSSIWSSPSVNPATNTIFVTTGNGYTTYGTEYSDSVLSVNATTMQLENQWKIPDAEVISDGDFGVTPTLFTPPGGDPMLTAANKNGYLYGFYQSNLTLAWQTRICCVVNESEAISTAYADGVVYAVGAATTIDGVNYTSSVLALDPLTGAILWQDGFPGYAWLGYAAPLWVNGALIIADGQWLTALNATNGALLRRINVGGGEFQAAASVSRGEIFAGSTNGGVYAFDVALRSNATESRAAGFAPLVDSFRVTGTGGLPPYLYNWEFGDGSFSGSPTPTHTYTSAGTYHVMVKVTDLAGNVSSNNLTVEVGPGYAVTFTETGLVSGTPWGVSLGGITENSTGARLTFGEPNGTYSYTVGSIPGMLSFPASGNLTVDGAAVPVSLTFASASAFFALEFTETGLPHGTVWSATVNGVPQNSTGSNLTFELPDRIGTVSFTIGAIRCFSATPDGRSWNESGAGPPSAVRENISFAATSGAGCGGAAGFLGLSGPTGYYLLAGLAAALVAVSVTGGILLSRRRARRAIDPSDPEGSRSSEGPSREP